MVNIVTEFAVMRILGIISAMAIVLPFANLALKLWYISNRQRTIAFVDNDGNVVKEFTADSVAQLDTKELVRLHDRIRQKHDITIITRAAA